MSDHAMGMANKTIQPTCEVATNTKFSHISVSDDIKEETEDALQDSNRGSVDAPKLQRNDSCETGSEAVYSPIKI